MLIGMPKETRVTSGLVIGSVTNVASLIASVRVVNTDDGRRLLVISSPLFQVDEMIPIGRLYAYDVTKFRRWEVGSDPYYTWALMGI